LVNRGQLRRAVGVFGHPDGAAVLIEQCSRAGGDLRIVRDQQHGNGRTIGTTHRAALAGLTVRLGRGPTPRMEMPTARTENKNSKAEGGTPGTKRERGVTAAGP